MVAFGTLGIVLCISFVLSLILREVWCWYWKISRIVGILEQIEGHLAAQAKPVLGPPAIVQARAVNDVKPGEPVFVALPR